MSEKIFYFQLRNVLSRVYPASPSTKSISNNFNELLQWYILIWAIEVINFTSNFKRRKEFVHWSFPLLHHITIIISTPVSNTPSELGLKSQWVGGYTRFHCFINCIAHGLCTNIGDLIPCLSISLLGALPGGKGKEGKLFYALVLWV